MNTHFVMCRGINPAFDLNDDLPCEALGDSHDHASICTFAKYLPLRTFLVGKQHHHLISSCCEVITSPCTAAIWICERSERFCSLRNII